MVILNLEMPMLKWKANSSDKTFFQPKKKDIFKNNNNNNIKTISDYNLEIRPISSSSSSFGTESFLSYDSFYDGVQQTELKNRTSPEADVNGNNVLFEFMDLQEAPVLQSEEKTKEHLSEESHFPLESKIKMEMKNRQMFFTSMNDDEKNTEVNNFFFNIENIKKSNENCSCDDGNICSFQSVQNNRNCSKPDEKNLEHQTYNKNEGKMILVNPPTFDKNIDFSDREAVKPYSVNTDDVIRLRSDQFNKVSPLLTKHKRTVINQQQQQVNRNSENMSEKNISSKILTVNSFEDNSENRLFSPMLRDHWIMFEDESTTFEKDSSSFDDSNIESKLIVSSDENDNQLENLTENRHKTKDSIRSANNKKNADEAKLITDSLDSELSDEVISLDYESEEERKKLCDTPVKQFPDVELFQASSVTERDALTLHLKSNISPKSDIRDENTDFYDVDLLDDYPDISSKNTWSFWYRYPDRKKKVGSRSWSPVSVTVERDFIKVSGETKGGSPILREIPLHPFYVFTLPRVHAGNREGKMFSVKLQYVKYKEIRKLKMKTIIEHLPVYTPVIKLATRDFIALREFIGKVETIIRHIPTYRDKGITYRHEEIFIDCDDECQYLISGDGTVLKSNITVQMRLRVFITGNPELKLYLNDVNTKDALMKIKEGYYSEFKSHHNWIRPINYEYHPCVDTNASTTDGCVIFLPPDGCSFELLRFRVPPKSKLPIIAKSSLEVLAGNSVRLTASIQVSGDAKSIRHRRSDVVVYFPIPPSWNVLFVKSRSLNGKKQYIKLNACRKTPLPSVATLNRVTLKVSAGVAKYEPAFGALVWKLGTLPIIQNGLAADAVHTFECFIELPFALEMRDEFQPYTYVEFNVGHQLASGVSIEEILVSDGKVPDKWVCYRANYRYKVSMRLIENGKEKVSPCR